MWKKIEQACGKKNQKALKNTCQDGKRKKKERKKEGVRKEKERKEKRERKYGVLERE